MTTVIFVAILHRRFIQRFPRPGGEPEISCFSLIFSLISSASGYLATAPPLALLLRGSLARNPSSYLSWPQKNLTTIDADLKNWTICSKKLALLTSCLRLKCNFTQILINDPLSLSFALSSKHTHTHSLSLSLSLSLKHSLLPLTSQRNLPAS